VEWHADYADPASSISIRLACVRRHLAAAIERTRPGRVQVVSLCAGQGHDVIGMLPDHPRREDVRAVLVERDPQNAALAKSRAVAAGLWQVEVRTADASRIASFADALPADVLLLCGIFGNVSDSDIRRTVDAARSLCSDGATVIWTRHRRPPDLTTQIRAWFAGNGFDEVAFDELGTARLTAVGVHRLASSAGPAGARPDWREDAGAGPLFTFRDPSC